jgi:hypothetical protein
MVLELSLRVESWSCSWQLELELDLEEKRPHVRDAAAERAARASLCIT